MTRKFSDHMRDFLYCEESKRNPLNVVIADKIKVKDFIKSYIPESGLFDHIIWEGTDIQEAVKNLKPPCVIKPNNAWHRMMFIRSKSDINNALIKKLEFYMSDVGKSWEWYYKEIKPGLIIEKLLPDVHTMHRIYNFNGKAKMFFNQHFDVSGNDLMNVPDNTFYYAETGKMIDVIWNKTPRKHRDFDYKLLVEWAEKVANFPDGPPPFLRTDFFLIDGKVYFSEMTFSPDAVSRHQFQPEHLEYELGKWYEEALECQK